ncbi:MAG: ABC transporter permease subunit [Actinomycetota bacterium]
MTDLAPPMTTDAASAGSEAPTRGQVTEPAAGRSFSFGDRLGQLGVLAGFLAFWYVAPLIFLSGREFLVPKPHDVFYVSFWEDVTGRDLWEYVKLVVSDIVPFLDLGADPDTNVIFIKNMVALWLTTKVALVGLAFAIVLGGLVAMLMSQAKWVEKAFFPYLIALQAVPILALVPLIGVIWGFGFNARVIVCVIIAFFPIVANSLFGLLSAKRAHHELFTLHGAGPVTRLWKLMLPAALPAAFTGFRIAAGLSVIGAIVGDFFFRRGEAGIGSFLDAYASRLQYEELYGAIILSSVLGIVVFAFFGWLARRVTGSWHSERSAG